jgi:hypothetical protein
LDAKIFTKPKPKKERKKEMARNMVTRTVHGTEVTVKVVETATEQIVQETVMLGKKFDNDEKLKKAVTKALADGKILVSIVEAKDVEKCYGIPSDKFMELAVELDPKTRAAVEAEEAAETDAE